MIFDGERGVDRLDPSANLLTGHGAKSPLPAREFDVDARPSVHRLWPALREAGMFDQLRLKLDDDQIGSMDLFVQWCSEKGEQPMPATAETLLAYRSKLGGSDTRREWAYHGINRAHQACGHKPPVPGRTQYPSLGGAFADQMSDTSIGRERLRLGLPVVPDAV